MEPWDTSSCRTRGQRVLRRLTACAFEGVVWEWRGPSPYHFVTVPREWADVVRQLASETTYSWGMVRVEVRLGRRHKGDRPRIVRQPSAVRTERPASGVPATVSVTRAVQHPR